MRTNGSTPSFAAGSAMISIRCGSCASRATRSRAIRARSPTKPMRSRCSGRPRDLDRRAGTRSSARARAFVRPAPGRLHDRRQGGAAQEGNRVADGVRKLGRARGDRVLFRRREGARIPDRRRSPRGGAHDRARRARGACRPGRRRPPDDARRDRQTHALRAGTIARSRLKTWRRSSRTPPRPISTTVIDHALLGDLPAVEAALARFFHDGGDADYLMIRLIARLTLLHRLRLEMDQGRPFDAARQALFVKIAAIGAARAGEAGRALDDGIDRSSACPRSGSRAPACGWTGTLPRFWRRGLYGRWRQGGGAGGR